MDREDWIERYVFPAIAMLIAALMGGVAWAFIALGFCL